MKRDSTLGWLLVSVQVVVFIVFALVPTRSPSVLSTVMGVPVIIGGGVFLVWAFKSLGNSLTANPVPLSHATLRTSGAFRVVRHPIYTGLLISLFGFVILMGSWWTLGWWLVSVLFFLGKSRWEDSLLEVKFGAAWQMWAGNTPALLPFIRFRRRHVP
jgi:protein-S-isoprenylcysteine O-methyltransferase Ste14